MDHFVADVLVHEMIDTDNRIIPDTLLGRYINPGHTVEDMWFIIHQALGRTDRDTIERTAAIVLRTLEIGWDTERGGLFLFVDQDGRMPRGSTADAEDHVMVHKIRND